MASQVDRVKVLLQERARAFDATVDVSEGSAFFRTVISPVLTALSPDPVDTDALEFIRARLQQEYPSISTDDTDGVIALLAKPLSLLLEPFKAELAHVKTGQTTRNAASMTSEQATDLAANWLVRPKRGWRSRTTVRVYYASPRTVNIQRTSVLSTSSGLNFLPIQPQVVRIDEVMLQKEGSEFFVDIPVIAEKEGAEYDVDVNTITQSNAFAAATRITNRIAASGGRGGETSEALLQRVESSVTERSLTTGRGIVARLNDEFGGLIRDLVVVGAGDPEMGRDVLTGSGQGTLLASGICFIVGEFCLLSAQFENRGADGRQAPSVGDEIELNYWAFLYDAPAAKRNESFKIVDILLNTRDALPSLPSFLLLKMSGTPTVPPPRTATVPGAYPGVFAAIRTKGTLSVSGIPGGILTPTTAQGTVIVEDESVHVFGHQDVWVRPASTAQGSATMEVLPGTPMKEGEDLSAGGAALETQYLRSIVTFDTVATISLSVGRLASGDLLLNGDGNAFGRVSYVNGATVTFTALDPYLPDVVPGDVFTTAAEASGTILSLARSGLAGTELEGKVYPDGYVLEILNGADAGTYRILACLSSVFLLLDKELTQTFSGTAYRICREADVDLFRPSRPILPFASKTALSLQTFVGSAVVRARENVQQAGGRPGDTLEILDGPDAGAYVIAGFDPVGGGSAPVLSATMSATNSGLSYRVYRASQGVQAPLVRIVPRGVRLLDPAGQDSGVTIPYALPLSARAAEGFTGARTHGHGICGFVVPDPGVAWVPDGDRSITDGCYTTGCADRVGGFVAVVSVTDTGEMYLDSAMPSAAATFFSSLRQWLLDVFAAVGPWEDAAAFVEGLAPIRLGAPPGSATLVTQYEFLLPEELWDGRNNVFAALPDIDWNAEFTRAGSFAAALSRFLDGTIEGGFRPSILANARAGDSLTVFTGGNAGSFLIEKVTTLRVACLRSVEGGSYAEALTYPLTLVTIRDEFPVAPLGGLEAFFQAGIPSLDVPAPPALPYFVYDGTGALVSPWSLVEALLRFVVQWANAMGFDAPATPPLDAVPALKAVWARLFTEFSTGRPTAPQSLRLRFLEPTSVTVYPPRLGRSVLSLQQIEGTFPSVTGEAHGLTLPDATLAGKAYALYVRTALTRVILRGFLPADAGTAANDDSLRAVLGSLLSEELANQGVEDWFVEVGIEGAGILSISLRGSPQVSGADAHLELDVSDPAGAFAALGFSENNQASGTSTLSGPSVSLPVRSKTTTSFVGATDAAVALQFCPKPDLEWVVYPPTPPGTAPDLAKLPRDLVLTAPAEESTRATFWLNRLFEPSLQARPLGSGDIVRVHEQRRLLAGGAEEGPAMQVRDRVVGAVLTAGSPVIRLPAISSPVFSFTSPETGDVADAVVVGDLVYIEEGDAAGGYRVVSVRDDILVLDRSVAESTPRILAAGATAVLDPGEGRAVRVPSGWLRSVFDAVGGFLTLWAARHPDINGTYEILLCEDEGATYLLTLDTSTDFPATETDLHWAVTQASDLPAAPLNASQLDGRTLLGAVRPIRVYAGTPKDCVAILGEAGPTRTARIHVELPAEGLRDSVRPPYMFVRPGAYHISSSQMKAQGRDQGLYWFDVPSVSLGHTSEHNIIRDQRIEPVFGTYDSDGFWFEVEDPNLTFSSRESTKIVFSADFLPDTEEDLWGNRRSAVGRSVSITYDFAPVVDRAQALLSSVSERNTCADSLARHFCPSYVYLDITTVGGPAASVTAGKLISRIDALAATDALDLSVLERDLQGADSYSHPIVLQVVTHDLERRLVEGRSPDRIDDETLDARATTRTTYFIPGPDRSGVAAALIPDGEGIVIRRGAGRGL